MTFFWQRERNVNLTILKHEHAYGAGAMIKIAKIFVTFYSKTLLQL